MYSRSLNGRYPKDNDGNGESFRKCLKREDDPSDKDSSSSDETSFSDEDTSDEESSSEDDSEDGLGEDDVSIVGEVLNQILNAPDAPADPAAPAPQIQHDEAELEAITDRVLDAFDPDNMGASIAIMVNLMEEAAGSHAPTLGALLGHVMGALNQSRYPEEFGVRNPAPLYSQLPGGEEVTMELAVRLPEYVDYTPRYTREPIPPPPKNWQGMRGQKRKREVEDDGEDERDEDEAEDDDAEEKHDSD